MPPIRKTKTTPAPAPAAKSEAKGSGTAKAKPQPIITDDKIRQRAFEIYASRGYAPGNPDEDWFEAERQLRAGL